MGLLKENSLKKKVSLPLIKKLLPQLMPTLKSILMLQKLWIQNQVQIQDKFLRGVSKYIYKKPCFPAMSKLFGKITKKITNISLISLKI